MRISFIVLFFALQIFLTLRSNSNTRVMLRGQSSVAPARSSLSNWIFGSVLLWSPWGADRNGSVFRGSPGYHWGVVRDHRKAPPPMEGCQLLFPRPLLQVVPRWHYWASTWTRSPFRRPKRGRRGTDDECRVLAHTYHRSCWTRHLLNALSVTCPPPGLSPSSGMQSDSAVATRRGLRVIVLRYFE